MAEVVAIGRSALSVIVVASCHHLRINVTVRDGIVAASAPL